MKSLAFVLAMSACAAVAKPSLGSPDLTGALVVEGQAKGDVHLFPREKRGDFSVESGLFLEKLAPQVTQDVIDALVARVRDEVLSLEDLDSVQLTTVYDEPSHELRIRIPLSLREAEPLSLAKPSSDHVLTSDRPSGYLNLRTNQSFADGDGVTERVLPLMARAELVQSAGEWTLEGSGDFLEHREAAWHRLETRLVHDDRESMWRWTIGDVATSARGFMIAQPLGGVSLRKEYSIQPERTAVRLSETEVLLKRDSTIDVLVNGESFTQMRLPAGKFSLRDFPILSGLNKVSLRIKDDLGATETFDFDVLTESSLLEKGEHEFHDTLGSPWVENGGDRTYRTDGVFSSFSHRYGVSDTLTLGLNFQNYFYQLFGGIEASKMTSWGLFSFEGGGCDVLGVRGFGGRLRWRSPDRFAGLDPSWRFAAEYAEQNDTFFPVMTTPYPLAIFGVTADVQVSKVFPGRIVASAGGTWEEGFGEAPNRETNRASLAFPVGRGLRIDATYQRVRYSTDEDRGLMTLTWTDSPGHSSVSAFHESETHSTGVRLARSNEKPFDDWRADVKASSSEALDSASVDLEGLFRPASVRLAQVSSRSSGVRSDLTSVGIDSALVWVGGDIAVSQPVADAFALMKAKNPPEASSVPVRLKNLTSYAETPVQVDLPSLPAGFSPGPRSFRVKPGYRQGILVQAEIAKKILVRGTLLTAKSKIASFVTGEISREPGGVVDDAFFTNRDGIFVIENLEPGEYTVTVEGSVFKFIVPEDANVVMDLGRQTLSGEMR